MSRTSQCIDRKCLIDLSDICTEEPAELLIPHAAELLGTYICQVYDGEYPFFVASGREPDDIPKRFPPKLWRQGGYAAQNFL